MRLQTVILVALLGVAAVGLVVAQKPFREYPAIEYDNFPLPPDYQEKTEWTRARLRYPDVYGYPSRSLLLNDGREFPGFWTMDYPRSDRHLLEGVRRLMDSEFTGPVNIGSEEMVTINRLAEMAIGISGKRLRLRHIDGPLGVRGRNSENRLIREKLGWAPSAALGAGQVVAVDAAAYFSRPGPRIVAGLELLAHILHPELVPEAPGEALIVEL